MNENPDTAIMNAVLLYEEDKLTDKQTIKLFQSLIDSGLTWTLQGSYGRTAMKLIKLGLCRLGPTRHTDAYGQTIPSHDDLMSGRVTIRGFNYRSHWSKVKEFTTK